eukprot:609600-Rhodomonas_salina.1
MNVYCGSRRWLMLSGVLWERGLLFVLLGRIERILGFKNSLFALWYQSTNLAARACRTDSSTNRTSSSSTTQAHANSHVRQREKGEGRREKK